jgi:D-galactarolactone cycloisomerase
MTRPPDTIVAAEAFHLGIPSVYGGPPPRGTAQWPIVELVMIRIKTADGLVGWGEGFGHKVCATTKRAFDSLVAPQAIGRSSGDIVALTGDLRRSLYPYGLDGPIGFALSGLDIALWDLKGQRAGVPVYRLLNDALTNLSVPAYASLLRYGDADRAGEAVADAVRRGHRAVKLHEATLDTVVAAREAAGSDIDLSIDVNCRWSVEDAIDIARRMGPYRLDWIEEPCWPPTAESFARVAAATGVPIAAGENAGSLAEMERLGTSGGLTYLQPSAAKIGGISGLVAARALAQRTGRQIATHSAYFGPALAATAHFCAANGDACEWYDCRLEQSPSGLVPIDGQLQLSDRPGLGLVLPPDLISRYAVG